jgi:RNA polymerase sigma-70 factor (ECF subfamily)
LRVHPKSRGEILLKVVPLDKISPTYVQLSDNQIFAAIREGDERVFEQVFRKHYASLCAYGRGIVHDPDDAEEIVQMVFVNVWEKRTEIEITQSLKSYLYRAVHNHCLNRLKHQKVREEHQQYAVYYQDASYESVSQAVYKNELEAQLAKAIELLPEQCRVIFKLSRFEELRYQEIADQLGLSIKTVENQIGKALKILRTELADFLAMLILIVWGGK